MADEANAAAVARGKKDKKRNSQRKNRGVHWPNEATEVLIDLWAEETIQFALENAKSSKEIRAVYQNLKVQMDNRNLKDFTVQDLINKMKKLRQKYKEEKDKANKSGTGRRRKWVFFDRMDRILCDRPQVKPPLVIDSSVTEAGLESGDNPDCDSDTGNQEQEREREEHQDHSNIDQDGDDFKVAADAKDANDVVDVRISKPSRKRKRSNIEKSMELFCDRYTAISKEETERYLRAEEARHQREVEFQTKQAQMENERRRLEREHELNMLKLLLGHADRPPMGHQNYLHHDSIASFPQSYQGMSATPMYQSASVMHGDSDSLSSSSFTTL